MRNTMIVVPLEEYNEGVRATAILGAVCDMIRADTDYASDSIKAILGIKKEVKTECTLDSDLKRAEE